MKKLMTIVGVVLVVLACSNVIAQTPGKWTGTIIGNGYIKDGVTNGIAIGGGTTFDTNATGIALVTASGAVQIGNGSNGVANTIQFGTNGFLSITSVPPFSAANLIAGTIATAINGQAITNISAANINPLTVASAFAGQSITNISAANINPLTIASAFAGQSITNIAGGNISAGNIAVARITNAAGSLGPSIAGNIPSAAITNALTAFFKAGTATNGQAAQLFGRTFAVAPVIIAQWVEPQSYYLSTTTNTSISAVSTTTNVVFSTQAVPCNGLTNIQWVAFGTTL